MRQFKNISATIEELELHGFWHRRLETLIITGLTIRGIHGVTTTAFWLSLCRQLDLPTEIVRQEGPAELLRYLLHRDASAQFTFCAEQQEDGTFLFRAPRVLENAQEGSSQGITHGDRREGRCRPVRSRSSAVPPCRRTNSIRTGDRVTGDQLSVADRLFQQLLDTTNYAGRWVPSPYGPPRPSTN